MNIRTKIVLLTVASCLILLFSFIGNIIYQEKIISEQVDQELDEIMLSNTKNVVQNVNSQLETLNEVLVSEVNNGLKVAWEVLSQKGDPSLDSQNSVIWDAVNQYSKEPTRVKIPRMLIGYEWLGQVSSLSMPALIVDETKQLVGGTATFFQRMNEQGDMLRICTNVEKLDNTRAIGTYIPAVNPDGSQNPVVSSLLAGESYEGRAYVVNAWYLTAYEPIFDTNKRVIGALYFGIRQEKSEALRKGITNTVLGKKGYIYVLDRDGNYIISKGGQYDGKNVYDEKDDDGNNYIQTIIQKALDLQSGEVIYQRYKMVESGESQATTKVAAVTYFEPWDWIVGAGAYEEDFKETKVKVQASITKMVLWGCLIGGTFTVLVIFISFFLSRRISDPIVELTDIADAISRGDVNRSINIQSNDEIGKLVVAFKRMQSSLVKLMERAQKKK